MIFYRITRVLNGYSAEIFTAVPHYGKHVATSPIYGYKIGECLFNVERKRTISEVVQEVEFWVRQNMSPCAIYKTLDSI